MLKALASLRLTLAALAVLVGVSWWLYGQAEAGKDDWPLVAVLAILSLNLLAAIATNRTFRGQLPLLVFHLSLLSLVLLALASRLTYLTGTAEVTTGTPFAGLATQRAGTWHSGALNEVEFTNLGFSIRYLPGIKRDKTLNRIGLRDQGGLPREVEIGDQIPLVLQGYRFYTSGNKGFAGLFRWTPDEGSPEFGSINFPGYPLHADKQTSIWRLGSQEIQVSLNITEQLIDPSQKSEFRLPQRSRVILDAGWRVATLEPGQSMKLPGGEVTYLGLTTWMGYSVFYDWTIPWLLATCVLTVLALSWHFWRKFALRPWQPA